MIALLARDAGAPAISFQLLIYPATDQQMAFPSIDRNGDGYLLTKRAMLYFRGHYLPREKDWLDWRASPLLAQSLAGLPPAFVLTAGYDPLVDEGHAYADRLTREGVKTEYRNYADMIHGFITMGRVLDTANAALADCAGRCATRCGSCYFSSRSAAGAIAAATRPPPAARAARRRPTRTPPARRCPSASAADGSRTA